MFPYFMKCTEDSYVALADEEGSLEVKLLSDKGTVPQKANRFDAGFDLYSSENKSIAPSARSLISTDVAMASFWPCREIGNRCFCRCN